jgi:mannose-6-phosphate isomerase-like protein (cupin superfamily)
MEYFELAQLEAQGDLKKDMYFQFLSEKRLSVGLYRLRVGENDPQNPHTEDEVYYVIHGSASIRVGAETQKVKQGSIIYVAAGMAHKFYDIGEDLELFVFFAPAHIRS